MEESDDKGEDARLAAAMRARRLYLPLAQEDRLAFWDRLRRPVREDRDIEALTLDLEWLHRARTRADAFGRTLFKWLTGLGTVIAVLTGLIDIYLKVKGK